MTFVAIVVTSVALVIAIVTSIAVITVPRESGVAMAGLIGGARVVKDLTTVSRVTSVVMASWAGVSLIIAVVELVVAILDVGIAIADRWLVVATIALPKLGTVGRINVIATIALAVPTMG